MSEGKRYETLLEQLEDQPTPEDALVLLDERFPTRTPAYPYTDVLTEEELCDMASELALEGRYDVLSQAFALVDEGCVLGVRYGKVFKLDSADVAEALGLSDALAGPPIEEVGNDDLSAQGDVIPQVPTRAGETRGRGTER